ncbi:MAG: hypothetical protein PUB91_01110 [Bacteroidales bacterium]|nr:hypothetical protein [Bacteroidales bacterium]
MGVLTDIRKEGVRAAALMAVLLGAVLSCSTPGKVRTLRESEAAASLRLPKEPSSLPEYMPVQARRDTLKVKDDDGRELLIMKAVRDDNGEMVASDVIDAAYVTATFRNVAERHGKIDLEFQVVVPESMQDSRWQLRLYPDMFILGDSLRLDGVVVTGRDYRRAQLRGYQQYEKFLSTIISDSTRFINLRQLEIFLRRNIPALYAMRTDSTEVSDERFASVYGTTEQEAVEHYTNRTAVRLNERRKARREKMYRRYVKSPIVTEGLRLDTVMRAASGDFIYNYVQTIATRPQLRKVDIRLSGSIWESDRLVYDVPRSGPLTFYISSISTLADPRERYLKRVIERRVEANTACYVDFSQGRSEVIETLGNNAGEIGRIKGNLAGLIENRTFDLDSIVVTASASPEGQLRANAALAQRRSEAVSRYFDSYIRHCRDSMDAESGFLVDEQGTVSRPVEHAPIPFISRNGGENWTMLDALVERDGTLSEAQKEEYRRIRGTADADRREKLLSGTSMYRYLRENLYPRLRTVRFDFHLHRKGMVKDTVHTTELDTLYMAGVQAIRDRDYRRALEILRPYQDYNTAVACCLLDYNASAMAILAPLERTPQVDYLLAILFSRRGEDGKAVQHYLDACRRDPSYRHRGNLDPEISALIKTYDLNRDKYEHEY